MKKHVLLTTIALLVVCLLVGCGAPAGVTPSEPRPASQAAQAQGKTDDAAATQNAATPAADTAADTSGDADDAVESAPATEPAKAAQTPAPAASQAAAQTTAAPKQTAAAKQATTKADADDPEGCAPENHDGEYHSVEEFSAKWLPESGQEKMQVYVPKMLTESNYFKLNFLTGNQNGILSYDFGALLEEEKMISTDTGVSISLDEENVETFYRSIMADSAPRSKNIVSQDKKTIVSNGIEFEIVTRHIANKGQNEKGEEELYEEYDISNIFWKQYDRMLVACVRNHAAYIDDILPELIMEPVTVTAPAQ